MVDVTHPLARVHVASNHEARGSWGRLTAHRARVTALVLAALPRGGSLTVLGAGALTDLDVPRVLRRAGRVALVDLDRGAVEAGLGHWGVGDDERVGVHAPVDLTRILDRLPSRAVGPHGQRGAAALVAGLDAATPLGLPASDMTLSAGVLTQLFESVVRSGLAPDASVDVRLALREAHLRDLASLTRPGGTAALVVDVVSTTTAPDLDGLPAGALEPRMAALVAAGNFFTGANPYRIAAVLEDREPFARAFADVRLEGPWLWPVTSDRRHLTCALLARRRPGRAHTEPPDRRVRHEGS